MKRILLVGCPNSGKTALFNALTGSSSKVANYSGITVDLEEAPLRTNRSDGEQVVVMDLPGLFDLSPNSHDEAVSALMILKEGKIEADFHLIAIVVDFHRLEASLSLALSLKKFFPDSGLALIFNKCDKKGQKEKVLESHLDKKLNLPVLPFSAHQDNSYILDSFLRKHLENNHLIPLPGVLLPPLASEFSALRKSSAATAYESQNDYEKDLILRKGEARILEDLLGRDKSCKRFNDTVRLDQVLLHPLWGSFIFLGIFYLIFHALYSWATPLMDGIDSAFGWPSSMISTQLHESAFSSFIVDGVLAGVGGVVVFLPQIMILFFLLSLLEQSGYISRASILTDRVMSLFGLNGKAFLPFLSAFACSVPAIMSTRTIKDKKERLATLMVLPFITCSARLPVYILLVGTFIPKEKVFGIFDKQALSFFFLYFLGTIVALIFAKIFRLSLFKGKSGSFMIDLPYYQWPSLKNAVLDSWRQGKIFLGKVGTVILGLSIFIWFLSNYPKPEASLLDDKSETEQAAIVLEHSAIGQVGKIIEPVLSPIGLDWKMGVGVLVSFGARELFVSTMGTLYALEDASEESSSLRERILKEINPKTGAPLYTTGVVWSLLLFFAFACQCMSTLAIVRRETGSSLMAIGMFFYMGGFAYLVSFIAYRIL